MAYPVDDFQRWCRSRILSFARAGKGIALLITREWNFRIQLVLAAIAVALGFLLRISKTEWLFLLITILIVLVAEATNTAIERVTDLVEPKFDPIARDAKDIGAAAVYLAAIGSVMVGIVIFAPHLWRIWFR
ncbi:MAG: diacylglycerol kinase family protein [Verrucomicrobia bacterium]|nr:diacylglycerol kinase family protein [Verrucomicrobiota bacterium]